MHADILYTKSATQRARLKSIMFQTDEVKYNKGAMLYQCLLSLKGGKLRLMSGVVGTQATSLSYTITNRSGPRLVSEHGRVVFHVQKHAVRTSRTTRGLKSKPLTVQLFVTKPPRHLNII